MKFLRPTFHLLVFTASLLFGAAAIERFVPWPDREQLAIKREAFDGERDEVELLVVGSSRVLRGFVPEVFDRECAARGFPIRSYNFGVGGTHELEADHVTRHLLAFRPPRLRYVLLEYQRPTPYRLLEENRLTDRSVFWHSPRQFLTSCRQLFAADVPFLRQAQQAWTHLLPTLAHVTGYGRARELFVRRFSAESWAHARMRQRILDGRGYEPVLTAEDRAKMENWRKIDPEQWPKQVERIARGNALDRQILDVGHLESLARAVEAAGARLVLLVMPGESSTPELYRLEERGALTVPVLGFNRPDVYPELYAVESRFSDRYLSEPGAELFSRRLAERFVSVAGVR